MRKPKEYACDSQPVVVPPLVETFYRQFLIYPKTIPTRLAFYQTPTKLTQCTSVPELIQHLSTNQTTFNREMRLLLMYICLKNSAFRPLYDCFKIFGELDAQQKIRLVVRHEQLSQNHGEWFQLTGKSDSNKPVKLQTRGIKSWANSQPPRDKTASFIPLLIAILPQNNVNVSVIMRSLRRSSDYLQTITTGLDLAVNMGAYLRVSKRLFTPASPFYLPKKTPASSHCAALLLIQMRAGRLLYQALAEGDSKIVDAIDAPLVGHA